MNQARKVELACRNIVTMNAPVGTLQTNHGRAVTIWRRESGGERRVYVDIWNADVAS